MSNTMMIILGCGGIVGLILLGAYLKYKKVDIKSIITKLDTLLENAESYTKVLEELATGKTKKALSFLEVLEKSGQTAINYAEQLLLSGQIEDDADGTKRKETALSYIYALLEKEGINIDDNAKTLAKGIIESGIFSNKTIDQLNTKIDVLIEGKVSVLQKEKEAIQTELQQLQNRATQLTAENTNLKNAITTAASTVQSTQQ